MRKMALSRMRDRASWESLPSLRGFMADQLRKGRLAVILGAGISSELGLPYWKELVERCFAAKKVPMLSGDLEDEAERFFADQCSSNDLEFAAVLRDALYGPSGVSDATLESSNLLKALCSMVQRSSTRGSVRHIISFNFDDLLERVLALQGIGVRVVSALPCWASNADVTIYHPHGLLVSEKTEPVTKGVVFTQMSFDRIVGSSENMWRNAMLDIFRSHTCVFIGLSGRDQNLRSILAAVQKNHASLEESDAFWGIRISDKTGDTVRGLWERRGVYQYTLGDYKETAAFLLGICQDAGKLST